MNEGLLKKMTALVVVTLIVLISCSENKIPKSDYEKCKQLSESMLQCTEYFANTTKVKSKSKENKKENTKHIEYFRLNGSISERSTLKNGIEWNRQYYDSSGLLTESYKWVTFFDTLDYLSEKIVFKPSEEIDSSKSWFVGTDIIENSFDQQKGTIKLRISPNSPKKISHWHTYYFSDIDSGFHTYVAPTLGKRNGSKVFYDSTSEIIEVSLNEIDTIGLVSGYVRLYIDTAFFARKMVDPNEGAHFIRDCYWSDTLLLIE